MGKKHDLSTGRGIAQAIKDSYPNARVDKNGSYLDAKLGSNVCHIPDTSRTLPKPTRLSIMDVLRRMGIILVVLWVIVAIVLSM